MECFADCIQDAFEIPSAYQVIAPLEVKVRAIIYAEQYLVAVTHLVLVQLIHSYYYTTHYIIVNTKLNLFLHHYCVYKRI